MSVKNFKPRWGEMSGNERKTAVDPVDPIVDLYFGTQEDRRQINVLKSTADLIFQQISKLTWEASQDGQPYTSKDIETILRYPGD